jgi:CubicO group peptidase (beta-lactamase class C family)
MQFLPRGVCPTWPALAVEHNDSIIKNKAGGYDYLFDLKKDFKFTGLANATYAEMSKSGGAGQLLSSVDDLYKWNLALSSSKLLSKKYLDLLFSPNLANYAYGWNILKQTGFDSSIKMTIAEHGGSGVGFLSYMYKNQDNGDFIVVLSNRSNAPVWNMVDDIKAILNNRSYSLPKKAVLPDEKGNVVFRLKGYSSTNKVFVSGEFNKWVPWQTFLTKLGDEWVCKVHLNKGTYKYMFVVDGEWIADPDNPLQDKSTFTSSTLKVQ